MTPGKLWLWLHHPQKIWLRRALFQIHLWTGVALGLYVVVVCVSGSAIEFRTDLEEILSQKMQVPVSGPLLSRDQFRQAVQRAYPEYTVRSMKPGRFSGEATDVLIARGWIEKRRLFNPYTGADVGWSPDTLFRWLRWWGDLHGNLLMGPLGLRANGVGGFLTAVMCLSGMVLWWPGIATWRRGFWIRRNVGWKRLNWDLHTASGFWLFAILLMWGVTGAYFIFPDPFRAVVNYFTPIQPPPTKQVTRAPQPSTVQPPGPAAAGSGPQRITIVRVRRPRTKGEKILRGFSSAHYGNFGGWPLKVLYLLLGLAPAILFVTGMIMWWNRVLGPAARRLLRRVERAPAELVTTTSEF